MEKEKFVDVNNPWWLLERDIYNIELKNARDQLTKNLQWDITWIQDQYRVEELYQGIYSRNSYLITNLLDEATDEYKQLEWLKEVLTLTQPPEQAKADAAPQTANAQTAPAQTATEQAAATTATTAEQAATTPTATEEPAASWDANWGMFLRYVNNSYQYSLSTVLADGPGTATPTGSSDGHWHDSPESAGAARHESTQLRDSLNEMAQNPDIPISAEDVAQVMKDPNYQQAMEEAARELEQELAAAEQEG